MILCFCFCDLLFVCFWWLCVSTFCDLVVLFLGDVFFPVCIFCFLWFSRLCFLCFYFSVSGDRIFWVTCDLVVSVSCDFICSVYFDYIFFVSCALFDSCFLWFGSFCFPLFFSVAGGSVCILFFLWFGSLRFLWFVLCSWWLCVFCFVWIGSLCFS